jgi:hypothetical protein
MAIVRTQYFNGTNGVALDTTNTDYETFFGTARFSSTYAREGTTGAEFYAGTTATATYARYSFPETPVRYLSRYRQQAFPSALTTMYRFRRVGTTQFLLRMSSSGLWSIADSASTIVSTMTKPIVANQPYRLEIDVVNQVVTMRIYLGTNIDGTTADDTISATLVFPSGSGSGAFDDYDEGFITARASYSVFVDAIRDGDSSNPGIYVEPGLISTSTESKATGYTNQRKIDRCQNGVLWATYQDAIGGGYAVRLRYSLDDGVTWSAAQPLMNASGSMGSTYAANHSFFIDIDDYAHLVTKDPADGFVYYRRGTPDASRTTWSWSAPLNMVNYPGGPNSSGVTNFPDVIAHRDGSGWVAHVVQSRSDSFDYVYWTPIFVAANGTITRGTHTLIGGTYGNSVSKFSSIDFNHVGDGKTVKGGTPHLYVAWSAGATGSGKGIRFKKATYSGGAWAWGTEREIDTTHYLPDNNDYWMNCMFDGTRVVMVGLFGASDIYLYQRDAGDTTTTANILRNGASNWIYGGSATYDADGNLYLVGGSGSAAPYSVSYRKWTRSTGEVSPYVQIDASGNGSPYASVKRSTFNNKIDYIYTDGASSPYSIRYGSISIPSPLSNENISVRLTTDTGTVGDSQPGTPSGSLGGYTSTTDALSGTGSFFDDITNNDNQSSTTDYRAIDILNTNADYSLKNVKLFIVNMPGGAYVTAAKDNVGAVSRSASTQGASIPNETTAPTGVGTFTDATNGLLLGDIGPNQIIRVWLKRTVDNVPSMNNDGFLMYVEAAGENKLNDYSSTAEGPSQTPTWGLPTQFSSATFEVSTEQAHSGTSSWKITSPDYEGVGITPLSSPSTSVMRFDGWIYQASGSPQNVIIGGMSAENGYYEDYPVLVPNAVWTPFTQYIPSGYDGIVIYPSDAPLTFYLDDMVYMEAPLIGPPVAGGDELLTDSQRLGEVDDGSIWNWSGSVISTSHSKTGTSSWSATSDQAPSIDVDGAFGTDGVSGWTWTGWLYQETGSDRIIIPTVEGAGTDDSIEITLPSGVWTQFTLSSTQDSGKPLLISLYHTYPSGWNAGEALYFDDMSFKVIHEVQMLTEYQRTASGPVTESWKTFSSGTPSVRSTTTYQTEPASWTIPAPEWMKIDLSLPLVAWKFKVWAYQEITDFSRDVYIGVDTVHSWSETSYSLPDHSWMSITLTDTTDLKDIYINAQSTWESGETLYFDDVSFTIAPPYPGGITTTWNIEQNPWPRVSVWNGTEEVAVTKGVWDGSASVVFSTIEIWSPYTENYEGVY